MHRAAAPRPAWPEPGRTVNWFDFDYAAQPVAAGGLVYFGSSADDTVYALKAANGQVAWAFTADAPVRVAPHIADGRCYFAADDGVVHCLDAQTGALVWAHRSFARNRMVYEEVARAGCALEARARKAGVRLGRTGVDTILDHALERRKGL